ncbi:MAG: hypothetical protein PHI34_12305 [Acidobacteriota bacterium]|nr:hypothetical protein [Acidobacteriota bacterium]
MKNKNFGRSRAGLILLLVAAGAAGAAGPDEWRDRVLAGWKSWQAIQGELQPLGFSLAAGYMGDASSIKEVNKLDISAGVAKGGYPDEFHFDFASSNQLRQYSQGGSTVENVMTLQTSYERHLLPFFKIFGFLERFTDSYLSIQQRYEVGFGIKGEAEIGLTRAGRDRTAAVQDYRSALGEASRSPGSSESGVPAEALAVDEPQIRRTLTALKKKHAVLALGLIVTALAEVERAELELADGSKQLLDPARRYRLAIRPGLTYVFAEGLSLKWKTYFKLPVFGATHAVAFDGRSLYDIRSDTYVTLKYDLPSSPAWARKISLLIEYKYFFDNVPPYIPAVQAAPRDHNSLVFKIGAEF